MTFMTGPDDEMMAAKRRGRPPVESPPARGRHRDLELAIKAVRNAGVENFRVTVDRAGTISVVPMTPDQSAEPKGANEWDEVLKKDGDGG